jgi:hypothetical protein
LQDQALDLSINPRPTGIGAVLRAIELLRHQLSKPPEDGLGFCHLGYFRQTLSAKPFADLGKRGALSVREPKPGRRVSPENAVLSNNIFDLKQQFPIHQPRHVRQQTGHLVAFHPTCIFSGL